jgi:hypothetical protein
MSVTRSAICCCAWHITVRSTQETGEKRYPLELLHKWKANHAGRNGYALAAPGSIDEERLTALMIYLFAPPVK